MLWMPALSQLTGKRKLCRSRMVPLSLMTSSCLGLDSRSPRYVLSRSISSVPASSIFVLMPLPFFGGFAQMILCCVSMGVRGPSDSPVSSPLSCDRPFLEATFVFFVFFVCLFSFVFSAPPLVRIAGIGCECLCVPHLFRHTASGLTVRTTPLRTFISLLTTALSLRWMLPHGAWRSVVGMVLPLEASGTSWFTAAGLKL